MTAKESSPRLPFVVIAQLSSLPHYRIPFFRELAKKSAGSWEFGVVCDAQSCPFPEHNTDRFGFQILPVKTRRWNFLGRKLMFQSFGNHLSPASLLITDSHLLNLSYPWYSLKRPSSCQWAVWGHTANRNLHRQADQAISARLARNLKKAYISRADAFLAYTPGEAAQFQGISYSRLFVIPNTINLESQREIAQRLIPRRDAIRSRLGYEPHHRVFITVGRLLPGRRIDFLLEAFCIYSGINPDARLIIIGDGDSSALLPGKTPPWLKLPGAVTDEELVGEYLAAADAYISPGMIGLGILPPLIYELPLLAFQLPSHGPEVEYLNDTNSLLLPETFTSRQFAEFLNNWELPARRDEKRFQSIAHLTLASMVTNFDQAVRTILAIP